MNKDDIVPAIGIVAFFITLIVYIVTTNISFNNDEQYNKLEQRLTNPEQVVNNNKK